jgi:hypothetical protein
MRFTFIATGLIGLVAAAAVGLPVAAAVPTGSTSAADTVRTLQDMGYSVQINGSVTEPLSQCKVTGVHGLTATDSTGRRVNPTQFDTAYVDVDCPSDS